MKKNNFVIDFGEGNYVIGYFIMNKKYYMVLISINDGNRWEEPFEITKDQFDYLIYGKRIEIKKLVAEKLNKIGYETMPSKITFVK